jgi:hypothetical protein
MRDRVYLPLAVVGFFLALGAGSLRAQGQSPAPEPQDNPAANTGALKKQITTGGSYDAQSGNSTRSVTDIYVPGAMGEYDLDFTRYYNSLRNDAWDGPNPTVEPEPSTDFGSPGWSHSWSWSAFYAEDLEVVGDDGGEQTYTTPLRSLFRTAARPSTRLSGRTHGITASRGPIPVSARLIWLTMVSRRSGRMPG